MTRQTDPMHAFPNHELIPGTSITAEDARKAAVQLIAHGLKAGVPDEREWARQAAGMLGLFDKPA